jgi:hypothetical protein
MVNKQLLEGPGTGWENVVKLDTQKRYERRACGRIKNGESIIVR